MEPLFNRKGTLWEGGVRVPCIVRWPGQLPAGTVSSQLAITMDITATVLAAAQVVADPARHLDGIDLTPILAGKRPPMDRTFFWLSPWPGNLDKAIRYGRWKYISQSALFPGLLFDLQSDPGERHDLAAERPELLKKLRGLHRQWEDSVRAPRSVRRSPELW
jgi:arylsulfatase A-like enzyme